MIKLIYPKFWQSRNIIAYLLWPVSLIYLLLGYLRTLIASPIIFPSKVICVGNATVGGTGKTQIVIHIAKLLKDRDINFIIVTKAYGGYLKRATIVEKHHNPLEVGDESVILRDYGTVIATKKIYYATELIQKIKPDVMILDDFLQNPNFYKDLTILSVDAHRFFGNNFLMPAGPLRSPLHKTLKKSDLIICIDSSLTSSLPTSLKPYNNKLMSAKITPSSRIDKTKKYFAFCGIGNPERFFSTLQTYGLNLIGYKIFPDHHYYSDAELKHLQLEAKKNNALLITTKKDYVKLPKTLNVKYCEVELSFQNEKQLVDLLYEKIL